MSYVGNTVTTQGFIPAVDYFNGTGSATAFTLSKPVASVAQVQAVISNVVQNPSDAYTVSGNTITFTSAPPTGTNNVYVYYTSPITQVIAPGQGTVTTTSLAAGFTLPVASGGTGGTTSTGTGAVVLATSPTITTPTISQITSATATALTLQSAGTTAITVDTSQNVGIGTTSPTALRTKNLEVSSSGTNDSAAVIVNKRGTGIATMRLATVGAATGFDVNFNFPNTGDLGFYDLTAATTRVAIDSSGNLLVGTATSVVNPGIALIPTGRLNIGRSNDDAVAEFYRSGTRVGQINVTTTNTTYVTSSDYRLKNTIAPMTGALSTVQALKPVTYKWKSTGEDGQGFIAHELQAIVPECVTGEKDAVDADGNPQYQGIDTSFLVATLTAAIQEQQAIIESLTARITVLENR